MERSTQSKPLFADVGVIGLLPEAWGGPWMARHQLMTRLARYFHVLWVEPPEDWREWLPRGFARHHRTHMPEVGIPGFDWYQSGRWLPRIYRPRGVGKILDRLRLATAKAMLRKRGCKKIIIYVWRPELGAALDLLDHDVSCYQIDDEYTFSDVEQPVNIKEMQLIRRVDQVILHSPALMEKKGRLNTSTILVPNGVDYAAYTRPQIEPVDLGSIPHPRIGYVGVIKKQLNFQLLITLAKRHPDWSFVFVGPIGFLGDNALLLQQLQAMRNVFFLGPKSVNLLPAYTQHMDVCTLCYEINDYTKFIYPLKLHEYLASGRPIVGVPIPSVIEFSRVIQVAESSEEWSIAIHKALLPVASEPAAIRARRDIARQHDWNQITRNIAEALCQQLGGEYCNQLASLSAPDLQIQSKEAYARNNIGKTRSTTTAAHHAIE